MQYIFCQAFGIILSSLFGLNSAESGSKQEGNPQPNQKAFSLSSNQAAVSSKKSTIESKPIQENLIRSEAPSLFAYISPPKGWEIADPKHLAKSVQISFVKRNGGKFTPSINLAIEPSHLSLPEYLKVIRQLHESNRLNSWRQLGKVNTLSGTGQLTEMDTVTEWGSVRVLQLILAKSGSIYVVTGAALKEEIGSYYKEFQETFRSLQITSDLILAIPEANRRESLKEQIQLLSSTCTNQQTSLHNPEFQKSYWLPFQYTIVHQYEDMGPHWQVLLLKNIQQKLLAASDL